MKMARGLREVKEVEFAGSRDGVRMEHKNIFLFILIMLKKRLLVCVGVSNFVRSWKTQEQLNGKFDGLFKTQIQ